MEINYVVITILIVAILGFVFFIFKRNRKDQKKMEKELNQSELTPNKHEDYKI